jgi:hypothetical protein
LLFAGAWFALLEFESSGASRWLAAYATLGAFAMLVKPTAAQLGIASFLLLWFRSRERLRQPRVWLAWAAMLALLALHLWYARSLYLEYGNTFGVLSGGDSKLPGVDHLVSPRILWKTAKNAVNWGPGALGALAIVLVFVVRRGVALVGSLLVANVAWTLLTLRYTSDYAGNHYHLMTALTAAHATAFVVEGLSEVRLRAAAWAGAAVLSVAAFAQAVRYRIAHYENWFNAPALAVAAAFAEVGRRGDLVVVRSVEKSYDPVWRTQNNFEDPRVFYLTRTHGWAVALDDLDPKSVAVPAASGARFYVETIARPKALELDAWLEENATLVRTTTFSGRVFALRPTATVPGAANPSR